MLCASVNFYGFLLLSFCRFEQVRDCVYRAKKKGRNVNIPFELIQMKPTDYDRKTEYEKK